MGLAEPKFIQEGWQCFNDESERWEIKPNAPEWAKREAEEFYKMLYAEPDENGIIIQY